MRVQLDAIQSLFGLEGKDSVFSSLCTDTAIEDVNTWFGSVAEHFRETHLLSFLRSCTDMADAQILDAFDILDSRSRGHLVFFEFYFLVSLLCAREEGQMKVFLFQRGEDASVLLYSRSKFVAQGTESSDKLATRHLSFFLQTFEMEYDFLETLADLGLNRADLTPREITAVLFAICKIHDEAVASEKLRASGVVETPQPIMEDEDLDQNRSTECGSGANSSLSKTRICCIS